MLVLVEIPDEFAAQLATDQSELPKRLLEDAALGAYCRDAISRSELQTILAIPTRNELDGLLKQRGIEHGSYTPEDLIDDIAALERLGFPKRRVA